MKLIVGLGNPGREYANTRHNIGFSFLDYYLNYKKIDVNWSSKFDGKIFKTVINGEKIIFLKPHTYMNLSGNAVKKAIAYFHINVDDILVVSDDLDLKVGNYKLRASGSCGGHNGLRDIEAKLGTNCFKRLKIGISNNKDLDTKDYVLGNLSSTDQKILDDLFQELCFVLDDYFSITFGELMNKYNRKNK